MEVQAIIEEMKDCVLSHSEGKVKLVSFDDKEGVEVFYIHGNSLPMIMYNNQHEILYSIDIQEVNNTCLDNDITLDDYFYNIEDDIISAIVESEN